MMRHFSVKALFLCVLLLVTGCGRTEPRTGVAITTPSSTLGPTGSTFVVQRGKVVRTLEFDGRVSPVEELPLYFKSPGFVKQVYVKPGDQVKAGDLLAELETDELLNQIARAEVALNSAQLLLSEAEKALQHEIAQAELNLAMAQARLNQAQLVNTHTVSQTQLSLVLAQEELARIRAQQATHTAGITSARVGLERAQEAVRLVEIEYQEALDRPWETQEVRDGYATALQLAQWNLEVAQAEYNQASANEQAYWHDLKIRETGVQVVEAELEQLRDGVDPALSIQVQQAQLALDRLEEGVDPALISDVEQAQLALEGLQSQLANTQIVAPVGGEVLSLSIQPARPVEAYRTVVIIGDPADAQVSADLPTDQLKHVTEGQKATIVRSADPARTWSGTIIRLPYPYGASGSTESEAATDGLVRISLEGDTSGARLGDLVRVTVVLEEKGGVLWLPPAAIRTYEGRAFVIVQDGERQRRADVELGIEGSGRVEILAGLEDGQAILAP